MAPPETIAYWKAFREKQERCLEAWKKQVAQHLLKVSGSEREAKRVLAAAIKEAEKARKKPGGKPQKVDVFALLLAADIQQQTHCKQRPALLEAMAVLNIPPPELRRLTDKLRGTSLEQFQKDCPIKLRRVDL